MSARARAWLGAAATLVASLALGLGLAAGLARLPRELAWHGTTYTLLAPETLLLLAGLPWLVLALAGSRADLPRWQAGVSLCVRALLVAALALALARPARTTESRRVATVYLVDVSDSVPDAALEDARRIVSRAWHARQDDVVRLVTFAGDARSVAIADAAREVPRLARLPGTGGAGTNVAAALRLAYGLFPDGTLRRAVVISDGRQTEGDVLGEAGRARAFGVRVSVFPLRRGAPPEVALRRVDLPTHIDVGTPFLVRAHVFATQPVHVRARLEQNGQPNGLEASRDVALPAGETEIALRSIVRVAGPVTYAFDVTPDGPDHFASNNRVVASAIVPGRPTVLVVEADPARATYLARALAAGDYDVDVRGPGEIPTSPRELSRYDFFVLSDVPADQVSLTQQDAIERYVRDGGGGFLMAGGEQGFGLGGWQGTRMEQLLPVRMDSQRRHDQPSLALALVIDKSGSMTGMKLELAKDAAKAAAELLAAEDFLEVVGFDQMPTRVVRMQSAANRLRILTDIGRLAPGGGTAILPALDAAYQDLAVTRARIKHVILLTDGQTQESGLETLVQAMRAEDITVSCVGLGGDVNRALLQQMANLGGGRAYFTNDPHNVPRIFTRETETVQRASAVEEYFQARVVTAADFLRGLDVSGAPYLHGYVATQAKASPVQVILASELGEPILARWRVGLGWALAWTSDVKNKWAVEWLRWPGFQPFWSQLVREHMRQRRTTTLDLASDVVDGEARVSVDAIGADDRFLDDLDSTLTVRGPMGARGAERETTETHALRQVAPGRYEARFPLARYGSFVLSAEHRRGGRLVAESHGELSAPYPREYLALGPDEPLLARLAAATGGSIGPSPAALRDPHGERVRAHEELWPKLLYAALALFVVDLLLRRVRLGRAARVRRPNVTR